MGLFERVKDFLGFESDESDDWSFLPKGGPDCEPGEVVRVYHGTDRDFPPEEIGAGHGGNYPWDEGGEVWVSTDFEISDGFGAGGVVHAYDVECEDTEGWSVGPVEHESGYIVDDPSVLVHAYTRESTREPDPVIDTSGYDDDELPF